MWKRLTVLWIGTLILVSLQPARPSAGSGLAHMHRPFHFAAFALTALLLWRCFASVRKAMLATVVLGGVIEVIQALIYHGPMEWWDLRDDALAACAALLLVSLLGRPALTPRSTRGGSGSG